MLTDKDYFALFGLSLQYAIDREQLDEAYQRLVLEHHPDFFATAPPEEQARADHNSALVNDAYRVLTDDVLRTAYLIEHLARGKSLDTKSLPDGFLQEMFLLQEEVEELQSETDSPRKDELREEVGKRLDTVRSDQAALFEALTEEPALEQVQRMQTNLNCERYLLRLTDALENKEA